MKKIIGIILLMGVYWNAALVSVWAQTSKKSAHAQVTLIPEYNEIVPGQGLPVLVRMRMELGWHTYWQHPGDSGMATSVEWQGPKGMTVKAMQWPFPQRLDEAGLTTYGYEDTMALITELQMPVDLPLETPITIKAEVRWLACKQICLPGQATLALTLPVAHQEELRGQAIPLFQEARRAIPQPLATSGWRVKAFLNAGEIDVEVFPPPMEGREPVKGMEFFPSQPDFIEHAAPQPLSRRGQGYALTLTPSPYAAELSDQRLTGVLMVRLPAAGGSQELLALSLDQPLHPERTRLKAETPLVASVPVPEASQASAVIAWPQAMLLAFIGGLILNLMPCVFPVLGIKVLQLIRHAQERRGVVLAHAAFFTFGVLVMFWGLAGLLILLKLAGHRIGWGFQFQSPLFVVFLAGLFFSLAFNLFGFFEMGSALTRWSGPRPGSASRWHAFFSGLITTLVATPCTAPFMGTALGVALSQPPWWALTIFTALGLGMACPVVLLSVFPFLLKKMPKPGPWMDHLKKFFGALFMLTVLWLIWLVGVQRGQGAVIALVMGLALLAMGLLILGRGDTLKVAPRVRWRARCWALLWLGLGATVALVGVHRSVKPISSDVSLAHTGIPWERYSQKRLQALRAAGRPVFLDFTASWCLSCQVNDRLVFQQARVIEYFKTHQIAALQADWTNYDDAVTAALEALGKSSIPVYVYYPAGGREPVILPEIITPSLVLNYLEKK